MADDKRISEFSEYTGTDINGFLPFVEPGSPTITYKIQVSKLGSSILLGNRLSSIKTISNPTTNSLVVMSASNTASFAAAGTGISITSSSIATTPATTSEFGTVKVGSGLSVNNGTISWSQPNSINISGAIATTDDITGRNISCSSLNSSGSISANSIIGGTINGLSTSQLKRECVYLQVTPFNEDLTAGVLMTFRVPPILNGKVIKQAGFSRGTAGSFSFQLRKNTSIICAFTNQTADYGATTSLSNYNLATNDLIDVNVTVVGGKGLDVWFESE